ncbi:MAG: late competence development ComFB family protein [Thiomicrorhabdus chilensis]|uniref:late competence development ComFB family protein n=1 Tax=Thiomicrorhabdus chilensis TaxID=63656 RepID=UPI000404E63B|nr:late competence development ComFB family protein [Thiomicrorhabdus chilensis]MDX1347223.1 late competence development ComFB family protein [Thiomicrorhabdus chilensis]
MSFDTVHNYFERLVFNEIRENYHDKELDEQQLADMACIALNRIPPRYIRYDIDMSFYMSTEEHIEIEEKVRKAVRKAYKKIKKLDGLNEDE